MSVSSYLELYLAIFGWYMFDQIWVILKETGLAYLPFIGMFLKNIAEPIASQDAKDAASTSLRRIEIDIISMLTVIVLSAQPLLTIDFKGLSYTKACSTASVKAGKTGTAFDASFSTTTLGGGTAKVPLWWYGVLALSGGVNNAIIIKIPCDADLRFIKYSLKNSRVKDPQLRRQVQDFYDDCFVPATAKFYNKNDNYKTSNPDPGDLNWIGSDYLVDNLYANERSKKPVPGFAFDVNRDKEYDPAITPTSPVNGKPTCKQWWTGSGGSAGSGLRDSLIGEIDAGVLNDAITGIVKIANDIAAATSTAPVIDKKGVENTALRTLIDNDGGKVKGLGGLNEYNDASIANVASSFAASAGILLESGTIYPKMYLVKMAAPVIQAMILMMVYLFLPFILVFSSYRIGTMIFMSIVIFSIKFWTVLWAISHWLDNNLLTSLQPESWYQMFGSDSSTMAGAIINFTTITMYIVMPFFWTSTLAWAGYKVGTGISGSIEKTSAPSSNAGGKGGNEAVSYAKGKIK